MIIQQHPMALDVALQETASAAKEADSSSAQDHAVPSHNSQSASSVSLAQTQAEQEDNKSTGGAPPSDAVTVSTDASSSWSCDDEVASVTSSSTASSRKRTIFAKYWEQNPPAAAASASSPDRPTNFVPFLPREESPVPMQQHKVRPRSRRAVRRSILPSHYGSAPNLTEIQEEMLCGSSFTKPLSKARSSSTGHISAKSHASAFLTSSLRETTRYSSSTLSEGSPERCKDKSPNASVSFDSKVQLHTYAQPQETYASPDWSAFFAT